MNAGPLHIEPLTRDEQLADVFPLVAQLRSRIARDTFVAEFRRQQVQGYLAAAGYVSSDRPVVFAGYRFASTLSRGPHLFVDDLVTDESLRGQGYGREMLRWVARQALEAGIPHVYLDSRDTAVGFYQRVGFEMFTSVPCRMDARRLVEER